MEREADGAGRHLLVLRFALVNVVGAGLVAVIYVQGWLDAALIGPTGWLGLAIVAVFLYGLAACTLRVRRVGRAIDALTGLPFVAGAGEPGEDPVARPGAEPTQAEARLRATLVPLSIAGSRRTSDEIVRLRLLGHIAIVRHVAGSLVFLGLVGTVIGFIVALSGVDPQATADVERVGPMVAELVRGMSIALYTTLIGSVLHLWLMIDYRMLAAAALRLYAGIVERGGDGVGSRGR